MLQTGARVREVIESQPSAWAQVLASPGVSWNLSGRILCVGSGTSYYLAQIVASLAHKMGMDVTAMPTQDVILEGGAVLAPFDALVVISRSGETSEAIWSAEIAKHEGKTVLGVTCNSDAPLIERVDNAWAFPYAHDHTVVMVRSFTSMLMAFQRAFLPHAKSDAADTLQAAAEMGGAFIAEANRTVQEMIEPSPRRVYILGAGVRYGVALEGALKSLEMSNENAAAYGPLEFRHGPWGSVTNDDLVVLLGQSAYAAHERQVLSDLSQRTSRLLAVAPPGWFAEGPLPGTHLVLPDLDELWLGPLAVVPLQWIGFYWALQHGCDPDAPRNLTQVVDLSHDSR